MSVTMQEVMKQSGVAFGTSGARGLVTAMTDRVCYVYARCFIKYCEASYKCDTLSRRQPPSRFRGPKFRVTCPF